MSRKVVVQLLILAGIVGAGALGIGLWQLQKEPGNERIASRSADTPDTQASSTDAQKDTETTNRTRSDAPDADALKPQTSKTVTAQTDGNLPAPNDTAQANTEDSEPTFDLMRVEPDGSTVVAGRSEAGAIVALLSNGKVVGKGIANAAGEFAIVLDTPLDPGAHAVTLETQDDTGAVKRESRQSMAVSVPDDPKTGEALVMLNAPGTASQVLQKPETTVTTDTAATPSNETTTTSREMAALDTDAAADPQNAKPGTGSAAPSAPDEMPELDAVLPNEAQSPASRDDITESRAPPAEQAPPETSDTSQAAAPDVAARPTYVDETAQEPAGSGQTAPRSGDDKNAEPALPQVTVEAVETENSKVFVAGAGKPNSDVRVYFDNTLIGETTTDSKGRWLMETENEVSPGEVDVRADQILPDSGTVVARAQVTFEKAADEIVLRPVSATGSAGAGDGARAGAGAQQIPSIIIRSGDNLWTISQRRYGEGLRYTTIYQANRDQIRNPDLIYPGQVFMMPENDRNWPAAN
ncbi:Ig-like domain-containing protein [Stappia sp. ES.058]|uniref:Ig-like domain-containing protein n=1 Tax=Stappia sp. ES.058 TaxID=1881061 RepID=UPI00087A277D|nr:Ig-like domain-containing protein [Stappia sp. ES.058]SDU13578.1 Nucleoid-associated protein YgaU, contains BON and LysM domains [Stappia sp. ES.058]